MKHVEEIETASSLSRLSKLEHMEGDEGPDWCSRSLVDHSILYFLVSFYAPLGLLMLIKDDCPSADVASQTNYNFQQQTPLDPHSLSWCLKEKKQKRGPGYQRGLSRMSKRIVWKFRKSRNTCTHVRSELLLGGSTSEQCRKHVS